MGKYADLFEPAATGQAKGKYADLFESEAEAPTYEPQIVTPDDITPTAGELSTLEAPEGSPQREDINRAVAGNIFAPPGMFAREPTLSELIQASLPQQRDQVEVPLRPPEAPLPEQGRFEQGGVLGVLDPALEAGESVARGLAPRTDSWGHLITDLGSFATPAVGSVQELIDAPENARKDYANARAQMSGASLHELPFPERLDPVTAAQQMPEGPEKQQALLNAGANVLAQMIMAKGIAHGIARPEPSHLRTEPLVPEPPPTISMGPGTIAQDVSRALERRFQLVPESRPEMTAAPSVEETLARTEQPPVTPLPATADLTRAILEKRNPLIAEAQKLESQARISRAIGQRVHPAIEGRLAEINQELNQPGVEPLGPVTSPERTFVPSETASIADLIRQQPAPPTLAERITQPQPAVEVPVRHGEFAKPGYTALPTEPTVVSAESPIWDTAPAAAAKLPPPAEGTVRLYHGGNRAAGQAGRDFTTSLDYATGYAAKSGEGGTVWHVDVPTDSPFLAWDESIGRPLNAQIVPPEIAAQARPLEAAPAVEIPEADRPYAGGEPAPQAFSEEPHVSAIANRFTAERAAKGEIGEVQPGGTISTMDLVHQGLKMTPEQVNESVSRIMQGGDVTTRDATAIRGEEARLSKLSADFSRIARSVPDDASMQLAADNAFKDLTDFHNGPIAALKRNWHLQGKAMQGEIPVDLSTLNGMREAWLKDTGLPPPKSAEPMLQKTADKLAKAIAEERTAAKRAGDAVEQGTRGRKLPSVEDVRSNIAERMKAEPCIT